MSAVNVAITDTFILRDNLDVAITGKVAADFTTIESYSLPSAAATAVVTLIEIGLGEYSVTFTPTTIATWTAHVIYNSGGVFREFSQTYIVTAAVTTPGPSLDRKSLRRIIGRRLPGEQMIVLTATGGSTTSFLDTENLQGPNDAYKGSELYIVSGDNLGKSRRVQSSVQSSGQLNWGTALGASIVGTDEAELWNSRGIGATATQVNDAINDAIMSARKHTWITVEATVTAAFDQNSPNVVIPAALTKGIFAIDYQDSQYPDQWHEIDGGDEEPRIGWWYDRGAHNLVIGGYWASAADTYTLRVRGYGYPALLTSDTDVTTIDPEWIAVESVRILLVRNVMKNPDNERWFQPALAEAAAKRAYAVGRKATGTVVF